MRSHTAYSGALYSPYSGGGAYSGALYSPYSGGGGLDPESPRIFRNHGGFGLLFPDGLRARQVAGLLWKR